MCRKITKTLDAEDNKLNKYIRIEEIEKAPKGMKNNKSPGEDGISE